MNGEWVAEAEYPIGRTRAAEFYLGDRILTRGPRSLPVGLSLAASRPAAARTREGRGERLLSPPPHAWHAIVTVLWRRRCAERPGARSAPRRSAALTYTSEPLQEPLDIIGHAGSRAVCQHHRAGRARGRAPDRCRARRHVGARHHWHSQPHASPQPCSIRSRSTPGEVYEVRVPLRAIGYRFLAGQRLRLSVASAWWPAIFPSPYPADNTLHRGSTTPSRLILPVVPIDS